MLGTAEFTDVIAAVRDDEPGQRDGAGHVSWQRGGTGGRAELAPDRVKRCNSTKWHDVPSPHRCTRCRLVNDASHSSSMSSSSLRFYQEREDGLPLKSIGAPSRAIVLGHKRYYCYSI